MPMSQHHHWKLINKWIHGVICYIMFSLKGQNRECLLSSCSPRCLISLVASLARSHALCRDVLLCSLLDLRNHFCVCHLKWERQGRCKFYLPYFADHKAHLGFRGGNRKKNFEAKNVVKYLITSFKAEIL